MKMENDKIVKLLECHGVKPTVNRIVIAKTLAVQERPVSMKDLEYKILSIDKSNIFRTLMLFREHHVVHIIEDGDAYKMMYFNGERKFSESDLQRMFKMVWCNSTFKADFEVNNGRGPADVVVSKGEENQVVVEFKLAGNTGLKHVSKQLEIYKKANGTKNGIIVIFYFTESEYIKVNKWLNENNLNDKVGENIFLIDCRDDNKESASKSKAKIV